MRACPGAEDLQDEAGAIDHLAFPGALEIALLHRAHRRIDDGERHLFRLDQLLEAFDLAGAEQRGRTRRNQLHHVAMGNLEIDRARSEEHTSELQSPDHLVCRLLLEKKKQTDTITLRPT